MQAASVYYLLVPTAAAARDGASLQKLLKRLDANDVVAASAGQGSTSIEVCAIEAAVGFSDAGYRSVGW